MRAAPQDMAMGRLRCMQRVYTCIRVYRHTELEKLCALGFGAVMSTAAARVLIGKLACSVGGDVGVSHGGSGLWR